jgi:diguanylate cyclase (GGDEF)-like protein/PAS domain S-box-containing protein
MRRAGGAVGQLTVGVLSPYLAGSYFGVLVDTIAAVVWRAGGRVVSMQTARPGMELQEGFARRMPARVGWDHIAGVVAIGEAVPGRFLAELESAGKPVVTVGHEERGAPWPAVLVDNRGGIRQAVEHLIWHGHSCIAFVGYMGIMDVQERYAAYCETLGDHGLEARGDLVYEISDNVELGGFDAGRRMVDAGLPSTAVVAATDLNAVGVMKALKGAGLSLPADQAVTGFDNGHGSAWMSPALSTASQDVTKVGKDAAELLLCRLSGEYVSPGRHIVEVPFIVRESCGCTSLEAAQASSGAGAGERGGLVDCGTTKDAWPAARQQLLAGTVLPKELAARVLDAFEHAGRTEMADDDIDGLRHACEELYRLRPSQSTVDSLLALAQHAAGEVWRAADRTQEVARRLRECCTIVQLGLTRAALSERTDAYYAVRQAVREEYLITKGLLASHEAGGPAGLQWLRQTGASGAVLGIWEDSARSAKAGFMGPGRVGEDGCALREGSGRQLRVASSFGTGARLGSESEGKLVSERAFPPSELLETVGEGSVASVVPISSERTDWGLLAMVAPANPACIGQDMYFVWAALFAEVLDREALTASLSVSEERYSLAARAANDGLWDWDLVSGRVYYSERWKELLGYSAGAISDGPEEWLGRVHPEDKVRLFAELADLRDGRNDKAAAEHRVRAADGRYIWVLCRALAVPGTGRPALRLVGSLTDVTERHALEEELRRQALYDPLTGLPNRALFLDRLSQALSASRRPDGSSYAVLWLDLDNFKELNDKRGHLAGDDVLVQFARRMRANLRSSDTAARFGGDEFAVLLVDAPEARALDICERLMEALGSPYNVEGQEFTLTASVGMVVGIDGYELPEDVLRDVDAAMYRAKSAGGGSLVRSGPLAARSAS